MPTYDYRCEETGEIVEVSHPMSADGPTTWGELCALADREPGDTPPDTGVYKVLAAPGLIGSTPPQPGQGGGGGGMWRCGGGGCCSQ